MLMSNYQGQEDVFKSVCKGVISQFCRSLGLFVFLIKWSVYWYLTLSFSRSLFGAAQLGRRMAELPVDPMLSKMILASEQWVSSLIAS